ncbi:Pumilio-family RNA binding repeat domain protein [Talaromyces stipitatus ATCC 10500]|uniref:Pumilio-family RNA binding repeat domain protein n=1 Tax=Talaromyces stipitatus (strain ATCC 10500 / CBS 375.48 / QM 6759 / NRRL 1006) TaxID=441959 RepID=B8MIL7_TALSN|nr:Pumilio-family RNA binding repeat domain protein [Talaromyces stipitatus ATCC 10500]EED15109.1 Pumilio-family RNA binding repeat domain protein [Talaromyces stipitatus ATCC 10500]
MPKSSANTFSVWSPLQPGNDQSHELSESGVDMSHPSFGEETAGSKHLGSAHAPLMSSKLGNKQPSIGVDDESPTMNMDPSSAAVQAGMDKILAKLASNAQSAGKKTSLPRGTAGKVDDKQPLQPMDLIREARSVSSPIQSGNQDQSIFTRVTANQATMMSTQGPSMNNNNNNNVTPGNNGVDADEMLRLQRELIAANSRIAQQEQELAETRVIKHTLDQALGPPSEAEFVDRETSQQNVRDVQAVFHTSAKGFNQEHDPWMQEDATSEMSESFSAGAYNANRHLWGFPSQTAFGIQGAEKAYHGPSPVVQSVQDPVSSPWAASATNTGMTGSAVPPQQRIFSGPSAALDGRFAPEQSYVGGISLGPRRSVSQMNRAPAYFQPMPSAWAAFNTAVTNNAATKAPLSPTFNAYQQVGLVPIPQYQPRPIGTPLSPTAAEFTSSSSGPAPWHGTSTGGVSSPTYVMPMEPINYRRLLDKNVSCDWKYIVDKIVSNSDQQASIFLQQKLKVGTAEQKYDIIEAIVSQAYPLMVNRFGNFLVQRCFEHGTPEQVIAIANSIKGNTLSLSMDAFGCHVIQKAFDCVPEEYKAMMVHELLRRIPETVIHRYACHVWQKLFELRWNNEPPQIMTKVNEALRGMWHEVALGETGSLVVQNIFENCVEEEKRPAIEEVLANIDLLSHGQFGNWCIQHICEHGAPRDKNRAIEHILQWCADYSMDQFASKVVEKCLKIGGSEFLDRYLARVCTGRADRPRMPLIDIAGDQYGNYLIQWILGNAAPHQRELVATHIRKHMVSLRGSKFGSRVAMLCCNPSLATRPGPGAGVQVNRFGPTNDDRLQVAGNSGNRFSRGNHWTQNYPPFR